jgi:hypothetical protein
LRNGEPTKADLAGTEPLGAARTGARYQIARPAHPHLGTRVVTPGHGSLAEGLVAVPTIHRSTAQDDDNRQSSQTDPKQSVEPSETGPSLNASRPETQRRVLAAITAFRSCNTPQSRGDRQGGGNNRTLREGRDDAQPEC